MFVNSHLYLSFLDLFANKLVWEQVLLLGRALVGGQGGLGHWGIGGPDFFPNSRTNALSQFLVGQMPGGQMSGANFWSEQMPRVNFGPDK